MNDGDVVPKVKFAFQKLHVQAVRALRAVGVVMSDKDLIPYPVDSLLGRPNEFEIGDRVAVVQPNGYDIEPSLPRDRGEMESGLLGSRLMVGYYGKVISEAFTTSNQHMMLVDLMGHPDPERTAYLSKNSGPWWFYETELVHVD